MKKAIISTALAAITLIGVGSANVAHADGTTPPPWDFYGVPQLGHEAVRGTGCGGDGSIGDVIPDGYWRGYLGSDDGTSIQFDLACVYFQPVANSTPVPDGWLVNNKTRTRTVATITRSSSSRAPATSPTAPCPSLRPRRWTRAACTTATTSRSMAATPGSTSRTVRPSGSSARPSRALPSRRTFLLRSGDRPGPHRHPA